MIVAVDGSGSMKAARTRAQLDDVLDCLIGLQAVLGAGIKRMSWILVTDRAVEYPEAADLLTALDDAPFLLPHTLDLPDVMGEVGHEPVVVYLVTDDVPTGISEYAEMNVQARHLVVVGCPGAQQELEGPFEITTWPDDPVPDDRLAPVARNLMRGCFDESTACGQAVSR